MATHAWCAVLQASVACLMMRPVPGRPIGDSCTSGPACHAAGGSAAPAADAKPQDALPEGASYEEYDPLLLKQNEGLGYLEFPTYNAALDEFFAKVRLCICSSLGFYKEWLQHCLSCCSAA